MHSLVNIIGRFFFRWNCYGAPSIGFWLMNNTSTILLSLAKMICAYLSLLAFLKNLYINTLCDWNCQLMLFTWGICCSFISWGFISQNVIAFVSFDMRFHVYLLSDKVHLLTQLYKMQCGGAFIVGFMIQHENIF